MEGYGDWAALIGGWACILYGAFHLAKYARFRRRAECVPGVIVGYSDELDYGGEGRSQHAPIVEFTTLEGHPVSTKTRIGSNPRIGRAGANVTVAYNPLNPDEAEIRGSGWLQLVLFAVLVLLGAVFVAIAVG